MIERYSTPEMAAVWTDEARMAAWLKVELAVCEAWSLLGKIPEDDFEEIKAKAAFDIEYEFPFGWSEIEGIHNRTDFDLSRHQEFAGKDLRYFDQEAGEKYLPFIIETSTGVDRLMLTVLVDAYEEQLEPERVVLHLKPQIAPIKAAVFPLVNKEGMPEAALKLFNELKRDFKVFYDDSGAVGRRYRRQDEAGTPYCITIDGQTLQDQTVTIRDRDSMEQFRISDDKVYDFLKEHIV